MVEYVEKIKAVVYVRGDSGLVIIVCMDVCVLLGLDEVIKWGCVCVEVGVDVVFIEVF